MRLNYEMNTVLQCANEGVKKIWRKKVGKAQDLVGKKLKSGVAYSIELPSVY